MALLRRSSLVWLAVASQVIAAPTIVVDHVDNVDDISMIPNAKDGVGCGGMMKKAICCSGDLLGLVHTGCAAPYPTPLNPEDFVKICTTAGKTAQCCTANVVSTGNTVTTSTSRLDS